MFCAASFPSNTGNYKGEDGRLKTGSYAVSDDGVSAPLSIYGC